MATFIEKIVEYFLEKNKDIIGETCFVLPNRRAGLYLKKNIPLKLKKTTWAPSVFSIEDFVCHITGINIADSLNLITELYQAYCNVEKEKAQPFDEFLNWAQILISDYNDCDINLADTVQIFELLNEAKAINQWNLDQKPLTDYEKNYLDFYNSLSKYYPEYTSLLLKKNVAYQGLIYKKAAEKINDYILSCTFKKIIFAGFNALTVSEEKIIKALLHSGKAEILWDSDKYYSENNIHEAGIFIRKYSKEWDIKEFNWNEDNFREIPKNIFITGVPLNIGQAEYAGQIISEMPDTDSNSEKTALVLADEKLLTSVLYSIPGNVQDINITMGYPLAHTAAFSLFDAVFRLYENAEKFSSSGKFRFYFKDITEIFNHPYCRILLSSKTEVTASNSLVESLHSANRVFFMAEDLSKHSENAALNALFAIKENTVQQIPSVLISLINSIRQAFGNKKAVHTDIEMEYLFHFAGIMNRLKTLVIESGYIRELKTLHSLFRNISSSTSLPFMGEPLKGLQVMGMLETRSLDFDNVIILSVNENILPAGKHHNTFIPFDIRNASGLSTYRQKEAIFAYHYYRLLQRAKNIHIIYNSQADQFGSGEKSRFITQLLEELPKYSKDCKIHQQILTNNIAFSEKSQEISISKTPEIIAILKKLSEKGFSPTALNSYISCPLKFYFSYVEKLEETEEVVETIDAATLGTVVHYVLNELYKSFIDSEITTDSIKKMRPLITGLCEEAFRIHYPEGDIQYGKNLLVSKVAQKLVNNFLNEESKNISFLTASKEKLVIRQLEKDFSFPLPQINISGDIIKPVLKGKIDRVDLCGNLLRIIDYKTGIVNSKEIKLEDWNNLSSDPGLSKCLQLLTYSYVYMKNTNTDRTSAGIISLRSPSNGFMPVFFSEFESSIIDHSVLKHFEEEIAKLITLIFERSIPFVQTDDQKTCENCAFSEICNK
jgi:ATP-dependent helicase/nuclease subunit B